MWELDCEESWVLKNWWFWTVVLEKTLESHLDCKEIQSVHSKGDQPLDFFGRNDAKAETPVLWSPHEFTHWKRLWCWKGLGAGVEGDDRGWDGWMASPTRWMWAWAKSGSCWWTAWPGVLRFMGSPSRTRLSDWVELNWTLSANMGRVKLNHISVSPLRQTLKSDLSHLHSVFLSNSFFNAEVTSLFLRPHIKVLNTGVTAV